MLSTLRQEITHARTQGVALGAFNVYNLELARSVVNAAEKCAAPVFIQSNHANLQAAGGASFVAFLQQLAKDAQVPAALHLDHGTSVDEVQWALTHGFTSVMYDGSHLSLDENIAKTREVVELAKSAGVTVEGELGAVGGDEDRALSSHQPNHKPHFTNPHHGKRFVEETGVDILAVAVGNVHGQYRGEPDLDFALLEEIGRTTGVPLALHGASGLSASDLKRAAECGVVKVNFNTDLRKAFVGGMSEWLAEDGGQLDFGRLRKSVMEPVTHVVTTRIEWLRS